MASNITEGLVASGMDVTLFATGDSATGAKLSSVISSGYEEDKHLDAKVAECLHISNLMEQSAGFDIIHNHYDFLPLTYSKLIKPPVITTIHGFSSPRIIPVYKKYNDSSYYVSISNSDRSPELDYLATVYNGIRTDDFKFSETAEDYLLFFGRIHPDKGTYEAVRIAKESRRRLLIAGIIQDQTYFNEQVRPYLNEDIRYLGHAGPTARTKLLGSASALLHPVNFEEPFGLSVAEAMLCGTPVIAFNRGSMPELIKDGETGFLVKNAGEAAEAVGNLDTISRIACHRHAKDNFSSEKMVASYLSLYKKIIEGR